MPIENEENRLNIMRRWIYELNHNVSGKSVLLMELAYEGHHMKYVAALVDIFKRHGAKIKLVLSPEAVNSIEYRTYLIKYAKYFTLIIAHRVRHVGILNGFTLGARLCKIICKERPDLVIFPCLDSLVIKLGFPIMFLKNLGWSFPPLLGILLTCPGTYINSQPPLRKRLRLKFFIKILDRGVFQRLLVMDELACEYLRCRIPQSEVTYLPHLTERQSRIKPEEFRNSIGIPAGAKVVGTFGVLGPWKGTLELVSGFLASSKNPDEYLLIMGKQSHGIRQQLEALLLGAENAPRIIIINSFVTDEDLQAGLLSVDIVALPYLNHQGPASFLFHAVVSGKPILGPRDGWLGIIIDRYDLGKTCDIKNPQSMVDGLRWAFNGVHEVRSNSFVSFAARHDPEAFERGVIKAVADLVKEKKNNDFGTLKDFQ